MLNNNNNNCVRLLILGVKQQNKKFYIVYLTIAVYSIINSVSVRKENNIFYGIIKTGAPLIAVVSRHILITFCFE